MLIIPVQAVPNQRLNVLLAGQPTTLDLIQRRTGMFVNVYVNSALIIGGVIGRDRNLIVRNAYLGFIGDLSFFDTQATSPLYTDGQDPEYEGLGSRYLFVWLAPEDLPS